VPRRQKIAADNLLRELVRIRSPELKVELMPVIYISDTDHSVFDFDEEISMLLFPVERELQIIT
jgi:hypothetical protein